MLVTLGGMRQILVVSAARVMGVTTDQGRLLWEYPWVTSMGINVAQPVLLDDDRVLICAGYDHGAAAFQVSRAGDTFTARTVWESRTMKNDISSSLFYRGYLYGL